MRIQFFMSPPDDNPALFGATKANRGWAKKRETAALPLVLERILSLFSLCYFALKEIT
jgi:hypothetical protein